MSKDRSRTGDDEVIHLSKVPLLRLSEHPFAQLRAPEVYQFAPPLLHPQLGHQVLLFIHLLRRPHQAIVDLIFKFIWD